MAKLIPTDTRLTRVVAYDPDGRLMWRSEPSVDVTETLRELLDKVPSDGWDFHIVNIVFHPNHFPDDFFKPWL